MSPSLLSRLEQYTLRCPQEVLLVQAIVATEPDEVVIFRGFSSSLMRPTAANPDVPVLPEEAVILSLDRLRSPYTPDAPQYIERDLTPAAIAALLANVGL